MILLNREEFDQLPVGTLFAIYESGNIGSISVKQDNSKAIELSTCPLLNIKGEIVDDTIGTQPPFNFEYWLIQFAVFEPYEILVLIKSLQTAYDVNVSCVPLIKRLKADENSKQAGV